MSWTTEVMDWVANTQNYYNMKFRTPRKAPPYVASELDDYNIPTDVWSSWSEKKRQRIAASISWIYSNIIRISNEVSAADFNVYKQGTNEKDIDHPLERIMAFPNEFFSGKTLLAYTIWGLSLDPWGAFWYLAPDSRTGEIREIWPIPIGKMQPVKDKNKFVKKYVYTASNGKKTFYDPKYICHFLYADAFDMWKSKTPLSASSLVIDVYAGITNAQKNMYTQNIGTPATVLSLDPNISDPDFASARQKIRDDWAAEPNRIAIVRAGSLGVAKVGLSNKDLDIVATQNFTRDEIDAVYMGGIQWRASNISGDERNEINKEIKDAVIYPLHQLIAAQIQIHMIKPFYGEEFYGKFDDIRAQDRTILIQERNIYWRVSKVDEARAEIGLQPYENDDLPGFGELPVSLASNPSFVLKHYAPEPEPAGVLGGKPDDVGNLPDSQDAEMMVNQLAEGKASIDIKAAVVDGMTAELKRYKKVVVRDYRKHGDGTRLAERNFDTVVIPPDVMESIKVNLYTVTTEERITEIFSEWLQ